MGANQQIPARFINVEIPRRPAACREDRNRFQKPGFRYPENRDAVMAPVRYVKKTAVGGNPDRGCCAFDCVSGGKRCGILDPVHGTVRQEFYCVNRGIQFVDIVEEFPRRMENRVPGSRTGT